MSGWSFPSPSISKYDVKCFEIERSVLGRFNFMDVWVVSCKSELSSIKVLRFENYFEIAIDTFAQKTLLPTNRKIYESFSKQQSAFNRHRSIDGNVRHRQQISVKLF